MDLNDVIHLLHIDGDAAIQRGNMPLKGRAGSVGNHRYPMRRTEFYDLADFFRGFGGHYSVRGGTGVKGLVLAEAFPERRRLGKTLTKLRLKVRDDLGHCRCRNLDWSLISHG